MRPDITTDSRDLQNGDIFFCDLNAESYLNSSIIDKALSIYVNQGFAGRSAIKSGKIKEVNDFRDELIKQLQDRYKVPSKIIGITGTKGKTSTCWFIFQILTKLGTNAAYFGTIGAFYSTDGIINSLDVKDSFTTMPIHKLYQALDQVCSFGVDVVALEVSSHSLIQGRVDGLNIDISGFTSFSQDHLDYHKTMEEYLDAKKILFSKYQKSGNNAILNADIKESDALSDVCVNNGLVVNSIGYEGNSIKLKSITAQNLTQLCDIIYQSKEYTFQTNILGSFQVNNLLIAIQAVMLLGFGIQAILGIVPHIKAPAGRLDKIDDPVIGANIFIDYAHTPDSLEKALLLLSDVKNSLNSRLITVFGCGGDRDPLKRPIMGCIACLLSDIVIVTSDNPRTEDPSDIINQILNFKNQNEFIKANISNLLLKYSYKNNELDLNKIKEKITVIPDRKEAILFSLKDRRKDDIILIAGKGHEDYQIIGKEKLPFSDYKVVEEYIFH